MRILPAGNFYMSVRAVTMAFSDYVTSQWFPIHQFGIDIPYKEANRYYLCSKGGTIYYGK